MIQSWTNDANDRMRDIPADEADTPFLLQRIAQGDSLAFWAIWMLYWEELFSRCLRWMGGNREEAEDALSSASLKACKYLSAHAQDIVNVKGWLIRLLHNHCMSIQRTRKQHDHIMQKISTLPQPKPAWQPVVCESPEEIASRQQILQDVHYAIGTLPPHLHDTAELRLVCGLSYHDIANQLNLSPENARKRMQQARSILRTSLLETAMGTKASRGSNGLPHQRPRIRSLPGKTARQTVRQPVGTVSTNASGRPASPMA